MFGDFKLTIDTVTSDPVSVLLYVIVYCCVMHINKVLWLDFRHVFFLLLFFFCPFVLPSNLKGSYGVKLIWVNKIFLRENKQEYVDAAELNQIFFF